MKQSLLKLLLSAAVFALAINIAYAEDNELADRFKRRDIDGTILISSLNGEIEYLHNSNRAQKRFLPASTFKIPNTLIALEEGVIQNEKDIIEWDGEDKGWSQWNKDQSLETAFPLSCIWFYQELASRVGDKKYRSYLERMDYGNRKTGQDVKSFWLDGDLKISVFEQVQFLKKLYRGKLPYEKQYLELLKTMMVVDETEQYVIRAKTGWATRIKPQHGWYVGYVETSGQVWFFATNLQINKKGDAQYRKKITMEALKLKGII